MDCRFCRPLSIIIIPFNWAFVKLWVVASLRLFPDRYLECSFSVLLVKYRALTLVANWAGQRIALLVKAEGMQGDSLNIGHPVCIYSLSLVAQMVKHLPSMQETQVPALGWEDPLEKEMATHSSTPAWKIPWMEEPGRLQSRGSQKSRKWLSDFSFFSFSLYSTVFNEIESGALLTPKIHGAKTLCGELFGRHRESQYGSLTAGITKCIP